MTTDRKLIILQILIPNITLYLVLFKRYRTCQKNFSTSKNIKLWGGRDTLKTTSNQKKIFLSSLWPKSDLMRPQAFLISKKVKLLNILTYSQVIHFIKHFFVGANAVSNNTQYGKTALLQCFPYCAC